MSFWEKLPATDKPEYFVFADQRNLLGIPHFGDVVSNIAFFLVGAYALFFLLKKQKNFYTVCGILIAVSSALIAIGSTYFHWEPNSQTLFWDRLPMSVAFSTVMAMIIGDRSQEKFGWWTLLTLVPLGILTVIGWNQGWLTLRPYILLQYGSILAVFIIALASKKKGEIPTRSIFASLGLYVTAKIFESNDLTFFELTGLIISGHTIKHLLAAIAIYKILDYMNWRRAEKELV